MKHGNLFVLGLDVDDKSFHGCAISISTGEVHDLRCSPSATALSAQLSKLKIEPSDVRVCYEATYLGFSLCRQLQALGFSCDVIAPSLIPRNHGAKVKTDRLDAEKLARYYLAGLLTKVTVPDLEQETDRDLVRSRKFLLDQLNDLKKHINAIARRLGWDYKTEAKGKKTLWTIEYVKWLKNKAESCPHRSLKQNLTILLKQYTNTKESLSDFEEQLEALSEQPQYKATVKGLTAFRGIERLTALVLVTELGDINRFSHPKQLTSYAGLDIIEKSSGGHERKYNISKDGNRYIRTAVVEACQKADLPTTISRRLKARRAGIQQNQIDIADRCMHRLNKKARRLLAKGKTRNKVKVACAREMLGFVWESMRSAAI